MFDFDEVDMKELENTITLCDENGNETEFEFLDLIEYKDNEYVVLLPCDDPEDAGEVVILMVDDTNEYEESYTSLDDEETLNAVYDIFREKFKDEFNFVG